jgi:hypothetical protein
MFLIDRSSPTSLSIQTIRFCLTNRTSLRFRSDLTIRSSLTIH